MIEVLPDVGIAPDYGLKQSGSFRVKTVTFGDGYEQRIPDGINTVRRKWSVSWSMLNKAQKDMLEEFLYRMKGAYSFVWHIPDSDDAHKVVCKSPPTWVADDYGNYRLSATFDEDLNP